MYSEDTDVEARLTDFILGYVIVISRYTKAGIQTGDKDCVKHVVKYLGEPPHTPPCAQN